MKNKYKHFNPEEHRIIELLKQQARESWSGETGEERARVLESFLLAKLKHYSEKLGLTEQEILKALENRRDYSAINYYQEANFPQLDGVDIFDTLNDYLKKYPSKKFICPMCKGISTDYEVCNSGKEMSKGKICDWKAYGLFGTLSGGYRFVIKMGFLDHPVVYDIFKPVELVEVQNG